jgi:5'-deoxynucleotidase YfbR-like HD superfamily hydrolase
MLVLAHYFLPLEDPEHKWQHGKIFDMILWHDIDEIETGDKIGYMKTDADRANEALAAKKAIESIPMRMQKEVAALMEEYDRLESTEAKFAKAIDRIEPSFHLFCDSGKKVMLHYGQTRDEHMRIKEKYVEPFPHLKAFNITIAEEMQKGGYFTEEKL